MKQQLAGAPQQVFVVMAVMALPYAVSAPAGVYLLHPQPVQLTPLYHQPPPLMLLHRPVYPPVETRNHFRRVEDSTKKPPRGPVRVFFLFSRFPWPLENLVQRVQNYFSTYTVLEVEAALAEEADLGPEPAPPEQLEAAEDTGAGAPEGPGQVAVILVNSPQEQQAAGSTPDLPSEAAAAAVPQGPQETTAASLEQVTTSQPEESSMHESGEEHGRPPSAEVVLNSDVLPMQARL